MVFTWTCTYIVYTVLSIFTVQKLKFPIKDFFSKCDQIRRFLRIWSHLLKKSLMEKFIFCAVTLLSIFIFKRYLIMRLRISFYMNLMYTWYRIKAWFAFWLTLLEFYLLKYLYMSKLHITVCFFIFGIRFF